jgi:aspartoacylase
MLILGDYGAFNVNLAAFVATRLREARILYVPPADGDQPYLTSVCAGGLTVEIGPIPQGLLRADVAHLTSRVVGAALDFADAVNAKREMKLPREVEVFRFERLAQFPQQNGEFTALVHPELQGADYRQLEPGQPMFLTPSQETILYEGPEPVYPVFINEAAYYEHGTAMNLCSKQSLPVLPMPE